MKLQDTYEQLVPDGMTELDLTLEVQEEPVGEGPVYANNCGGCPACRCHCHTCRCHCHGCHGCGGCRSEPAPLPTGEGDTKPTGFDLLVAPAKS